MAVTIDGQRIVPRTAPTWRRLLGLGFDSMICTVLSGLPTLGAEVMLQFMSDEFRDIAFAVVVFLVFMLYQGVVLGANAGQTAGMYFQGIAVVAVKDGGPPSFERSMLRAFALLGSIVLALVFQRLGPFYIVGPLAMALLLLPALARSDRRALHDLVAGTRVVHLTV